VSAETGRGPLHAVVLLVGAVGIAYEIALMRVLSVAQWHHFAYMIISIAMLGFAASGTVLAMLRRRIEGRERPLLALGALGLSVSLVTCFAASQALPFETFRLVTERAQFGYLFALYLVLAPPFFLASWCIALGFLLEPARVGRLYFFNMLGSGLGAAAVVGLLFWLRPALVPAALTVPAALAFSLSAVGLGRRWQLGLVGPAATLLLAGGQEIRLSEYKGLAYAQRLPEARIVARAHSPLSELTALASPAIRETPGQLSGYPMTELGRLPEQIGLYFDGGSVSAVNRFDGSLEPFAFLDYVTGALPYRLLERPAVLVVGAGGGTEVLSALAHGARHVTAVEADPGVPALLRGPLREFSGRLFEREDVTFILAEGRRFMEGQPDGSFDLIQLALLDSFTAAGAGVHALAESYLYTTEAVQLYLRKLAPQGILSVTRWLKMPPRDAIKLFATLVEACEQAGLPDPSRHLVLIRSWNTATLLLSRSPLSQPQLAEIRRFAAERGLDLGYIPGIRREEANRHTILERPFYYEATTALLSGRRETLYRDYAFHVRPATDDRPYFFRFFSWRSASRFLEAARSGWLNFVEWGYVALIATVLQAALAGFLLVLFPLLLFGGRAGRRRGAVAAYFGALGLAFMFLEIAFIQRFMLLLAYPVYAVAVVLAGFLLFSGVGSWFADRRLTSTVSAGSARRIVALAVALIAAIGLTYLAVFPAIFRLASAWTDAGRVALSMILLLPLAFWMGVPFPAGLQLISDRNRALVPWAWGVNGAASVLGAALATLVAVQLGFRAVVGLALVLYVVAAVILSASLSRS
jgi:spermidine synthase